MKKSVSQATVSQRKAKGMILIDKTEILSRKNTRISIEAYLRAESKSK